MYNRKFWLHSALIAFSVSCMFYPVYAEARTTIVIGALGIGYDYWEREYDNEDDVNLLVDRDEGDRREWGAWPEIELKSTGIHDSVSFRYAPVLKYDDLQDSTDVDHYLVFDGKRSLTKDWIVTLTDNFAYSNDPGRYGTTFDKSNIQDTEVDQAGDTEQTIQQPDEITQDLGRTQYWTNNLIVNTTYTYAQESNAGLGYAFRVLRNDSNDESGYDEYDRHEVFGSWAHKVTSDWRTQVNAGYIKGLYDDVLNNPSDLSQDLEEYRADLRVDYIKDAKDQFPLIYGIRGTKYEDLRQDIWAHELTLGWNHTFDSRSQFTVGAGPSYIDAEDLDGEWGYNAHMDFTRSYQHGNVKALVNKRYEPRNFTGGGDTGLRDLTDARIDMTYRFTPKLSSNVYVMYRYEDIVDPGGEYYLSALGDRNPAEEKEVGDVTYSREHYSAGAGVEYTFLRWFAARLKYVYYKQDGDLIQDSYTDHRVILMLTASKELWR